MELTTDSVGILMGIFGLLGILFTVYNYFRNPQIDGDKRDALLAQRFDYQNKGIEERFKSMQCNFDALLLQSNNHIHTVDVKVENLNATVGKMSNEVTRLATIIEERIPKR